MDDIEIDRTLRATLSAEPSPEFVARVRTTLVEAPRPSIVAGWVKPAAVVACAAAVMIAVWAPRENEVAPATAGLKPSATYGPSAPYVPARITTVPPHISLVVPTFSSAKTKPARARAVATEPPLPEVMIASGDVEALRQLLVSLNEHTFVASFDETPVSTPWVMTNLSVAPIGGDLLDSAPAHNN